MISERNDDIWSLSFVTVLRRRIPRRAGRNNRCRSAADISARNVFGIVERERVQITENSLENPGSMGGLNNFAEIYIHFPHTNVQDYERWLDLDHGIAYCRYSCNGVEYTGRILRVLSRPLSGGTPDRVDDREA